MNGDYHYEISYGKARVPLYRVYATPLSGVRHIPESSFSGRDNILFAVEIDVEVFGSVALSLGDEDPRTGDVDVSGVIEAFRSRAGMIDDIIAEDAAGRCP